MKETRPNLKTDSLEKSPKTGRKEQPEKCADKTGNETVIKRGIFYALVPKVELWVPVDKS